MDDTLALIVLNPILFVYRQRVLGQHFVGKKKELYPVAYYYFGCITHTDMCSHSYDDATSCNSPAKRAQRPTDLVQPKIRLRKSLATENTELEHRSRNRYASVLLWVWM